jgi:hypothetical protein
MSTDMKTFRPLAGVWPAAATPIKNIIAKERTVVFLVMLPPKVHGCPFRIPMISGVPAPSMKPNSACAPKISEPIIGNKKNEVNDRGS